jgi:hypothetical protein
MAPEAVHGLPAKLLPWCRTLRGEQAFHFSMRGGPTALEMWRALRDRHAGTGLWPLILGDVSDLVLDQLTWRVQFAVDERPGIPSLDDIPTAPELFVEWLGDPTADAYLGDVPRHLAKLEADEATIRARVAERPDEDAVRALLGEYLQMALVPAAGGWEVPALLAWPGAEKNGHGGAEHLAVLKFWSDSYGAELVSLGIDTMECLVDRPPDEARGAFDLAVQHYAYCPELMDNLVPAMGALAATLFGRHWWFSWA